METKKYDILRIPKECLLHQPSGNKQKPKRIKFVEKLQKTDHGIYTYFPKAKYPFKGYLGDYGFTTSITFPKKTLIVPLKVISRQKLPKIFIGLTLLLPEKIFRDNLVNLMLGMMEIANQGVYPFFLQPKFYCKSGRAIYRAFWKMIEKENKTYMEAELLQKISRLFCQIWEFDSYYRMIGQDIATLVKEGKITIEQIIKNPEIIFEIIEERDNHALTKSKWKEMKRFLSIAMLFKGHFIRKILKEFLYNLDFNEVAMDDADEYYYLPYKQYNIKGIPFKERMELRKKIDKKHVFKNEKTNNNDRRK